MATIYYKENYKTKSTTKHLNSIIMDAKAGEIVDHEDRDTLNNRKYNLRFIDKSKNAQNRKGANKNSGTGVRNVNYIKKHNQYWVQLMKNGQRYKWIFSADEFDKACEFAKIKREELFGEFAGAS
jgi:hypothetical protein